MRFFFLLILLSNGILQAQDIEPSSVFMQLNEVEQSPAYPGCEGMDFNCSIEKITSYFIQHIDSTILNSLTPEESVVILKFIIDREGKVRRPTTKSKSEKLKAESLRIIAELPNFIPAVHDGKGVNVPIDIPLKLESRDPPPLSHSELYDIPDRFKGCAKINSAQNCTQLAIMNSFSNRYYDLGIRSKGETIKSIVTFQIDENGKITEVTTEGSNNVLNKALDNWGRKLDDFFILAVKDGKNVSMTYTFPVTLSTTN